jgi:signal transduction histidine kinase
MTSVLSSSTATPSSTKVSILDSAQTILLCAQHQKRIIDDILTLSKLESNRLQICPERVQPTTVVEESIQMSKAESPDAQIAISFNVDESYKKLGIDYVLLDPARLRQVRV